MEKAKDRARFRINPLEVALFAIVLTVFSHSLYRLFFGWDDLQNLQADRLAQVENETPLRQPASAFAKAGIDRLKVDCEKAAFHKAQVNAKRVRIEGALCGTDSPSVQLLRIQVANLTNGKNSTVFMDPEKKEFLTDFLPMDEGDNLISVKFKLSSNKTLETKQVVRRLINP